MYTANGPITVQDPTNDEVTIPFEPDISDDVTVLVYSSHKMAVFGSLYSSPSLVTMFDISNPLAPVLFMSVSVTGNITSIAAESGSIFYVVYYGYNIEIL